MEGAEEKKKKVPAVPETLKKKRTEKEVCPKDASKGKEESYL